MYGSREWFSYHFFSCLQCQELMTEAERVALELFLASQNEADMHLGRGNVTPAHIGII